MVRATADSISEMEAEARRPLDRIGTGPTPYSPPESLQSPSGHEYSAAERDVRVAHPRTLTASFGRRCGRSDVRSATRSGAASYCHA
jgi:hypothetical protein